MFELGENFMSMYSFLFSKTRQNKAKQTHRLFPLEQMGERQHHRFTGPVLVLPVGGALAVLQTRLDQRLL